SSGVSGVGQIASGDASSCVTAASRVRPSSDGPRPPGPSHQAPPTVPSSMSAPIAAESQALSRFPAGGADARRVRFETGADGTKVSLVVAAGGAAANPVALLMMFSHRVWSG